MSNFTLYNNLCKGILTKSLTIKQKTDFVSKVKNIDVIGSELIYALIRFYQLQNSKDNVSFKLPYSGKFVKNDMKFELTTLPPTLQQILYKFVNMHIKSMEEAAEIQQHRTDS